ncbi:hypothetical protein E2C01_053113 [Portunus trituberculatus]|uniref:Uncharacterized protein n=1 Tax=Portunus trituberculatus TaxID=210409 RepID=A0A5B7GPY0_PORTR|nr:hypothetical protein [Portunus trituberculatus]
MFLLFNILSTGSVFEIKRKAGNNKRKQELSASCRTLWCVV